MSTSPEAPKRLYLFSQPRTRSNLWLKLFDNHPDLCTLSYRFQIAYLYGPEHQRTRTSVENLQERLDRYKEETYQHAYDKMMTRIAEAEAKGKLVFMKDHLFSLMKPSAVADSMAAAAINREQALMNLGTSASPENSLDGVFEKQRDWRRSWKVPVINASQSASSTGSTLGNKSQSKSDPPLLLPSEFLTTTLPIFMIRHPVRQLKSYYKVAPNINGAHINDDDFPLAASYSLTRTVYESCVSQHSAGNMRYGPLVIDGDDIVQDPRRLAENFRQLVGLDPAGVQYTWDPTTDDEISQMDAGHMAFLDVLTNSAGVQIRELKEIDWEAEEKEWEEKYDPMVASKLRQYAKAAMKDYLFLKSHKV